jgi:hypothetical protein
MLSQYGKTSHQNTY